MSSLADFIFPLFNITLDDAVGVGDEETTEADGNASAMSEHGKRQAIPKIRNEGMLFIE